MSFRAVGINSHKEYAMAQHKAELIGVSDTQLYKQAGNSVTVPVIKAIADRMGLEV